MYSSIKRTPIKKKPCKCGCGLMPDTGCRGYKFRHLPKMEQDEKVNKRRKQQNEAAKRAVNRKKLHEVQKSVGVPKSPVKRQNKPVSKFSQKMLTNLKKYSVLRKDFLRDNPICKCGRNGCKRKAKDVHHKKGRGIYLNVVEFWLPVARVCHRWITDNPKEAMGLGLTISRLEIDKSVLSEQPQQGTNENDNSQHNLDWSRNRTDEILHKVDYKPKNQEEKEQVKE